MHNIYQDGLSKILGLYATEYKKDGKQFVNTFINCTSIQTVCREIINYYKMEFSLDDKCLSYARKFNTDQKTLGEILSLIKYLTT